LICDARYFVSRIDNVSHCKTDVSSIAFSHAYGKFTRGIGCSFIGFDAKPVERVSDGVVRYRNIANFAATRNGTNRNSMAFEEFKNGKLLSKSERDGLTSNASLGDEPN